MRTVREWIEWAEKRFEEAQLHYGHGTGNSHDEACWLVLHAIGAPVQGNFEAWDDLPDTKAAAEIERLVRRRIDGRIPAAYLTGTAWFAGLEFEVSPDVLVPRSPLAEIITEGFRPWLNPDKVGSILDLCAGSGCIAIACAYRFPRAAVFASDISEAALRVAGRNIEKHRLQGKVKVIQSDLFDSLGERKYDLIVSNPPYVSERSLANLPLEFRAEPKLALVSGMQGLEIPLRIIEKAGRYLKPGGILVCEVGESQEALQQVLWNVPFVWLEFESGGEGVFLLEHDQLDVAGSAAAGILRKA